MAASFCQYWAKARRTRKTIAYQDDQLCAILKVVIDGAVHGVQYIWDKNSTMEDWRLLILDAKNALNDIN